MPTAIQDRLRPLSVALVVILLLAAPLPALAKGDMQARLDAPIARDTPAGSVLLVGMTVTVPDGTTPRPVEGTPVYLRLFGPGDAASTWDLGRETAPGHYVVRLVVPDGGVARIEIGIHGTSDLPIGVVGDAVVPGGITPLTAQVAPPTPAPVAAAGVPPNPDAVDVGLGGFALVVGLLAVSAISLMLVARRRAGPPVGRALP